MFKLRVEDKTMWSVDNIPVWNVFRRFSDFLELYHKVKAVFPEFKVSLF